MENFIRQIEEVKKKTGLDLSLGEDLSIGLMNLISLEEHFYFTAMKTNNQKYLEMLNSVRELRKKLLGKIVKNPQGEEWCISKHLLAASMRLVEVGTKELSRGSVKEANMYFTYAFNLYSLFFAINMKMMEIKNLEDGFEKQENKNGLLNKFSAIIKKIVDCCKE